MLQVLVISREDIYDNEVVVTWYTHLYLVININM